MIYIYVFYMFIGKIWIFQVCAERFSNCFVLSNDVFHMYRLISIQEVQTEDAHALLFLHFIINLSNEDF